MRGIVTTELFGSDGKLLKKDKQPSRSLVFGFPKLLYTLFTDTPWCHDTRGTKYALAMAAPPAPAEISLETGNYPWASEAYFSGQMWGIQISEDDHPITPFDSYIRGRLGNALGFGYSGAFRVNSLSSRRCRGMASDRMQSVWHGDSADIVRRYLAGDDLGMVRFGAPNGRIPQGLTFDGAYLWSANGSDNLIHRMDPLTGAVNLEWASPGTAIWGLAYDLENDKIYSMDNGTKLIYRHDPATGVVEDIFDTALTETLCDMEWVDGYLYVPVGTTMHVFNPATGLQVHSFGLPVSVRYPVFIGPYWLIAPPDTGTSFESCRFFFFPEYGYDLPNLEISGNEVLRPVIANPNGEFTMRRTFTNLTGADLTIRKVGIHSGCPVELIAVDLLGTPVTVDHGQELRVSYAFQITV